jgi:hypothetical protein
MPAAPIRALLGFIGAAISVLTFHQFMWAVLYGMDLMPPPFPMRPIPPLGIPAIANLCFWGGVYGLVYGLAFPTLPRWPNWLRGLCLGLVAVLVGWLVVPAIKGTPIGGGWAPITMLRSVLINGFWGVGVGLLVPWLFSLARRPRLS